MKVICSMVARYAELGNDGSLHVFGGDINSLSLTTSMPATLGLPLYYVVKLADQPPTPDHVYQMTIEVVGPDGTVGASQQKALPAKPPRPGWDVRLSMMLVLASLRVPSAGEITFRVTVDGEVVATTVLHVNEEKATSVTGLEEVS